MFAILAAIAFGVAFILHLAGGGKPPLDPAGLALLGALFLAVHLIAPWWPASWRARRPAP